MASIIKTRFAFLFSPEKSIFFKFSFSSFLRIFSLGVTGLIIMAWVAPEEIGIYNAYNVIIAYTFFLQMGVFNGLNRELPYLLGKGEEDKVLALVKASLSFAKILSISVLVIGIIVFLILSFFCSLPINELKMILAIILLTSISFYQNYLNVTYRTQKHFSVLSGINVITSVMIFISLILVYFFHYNGLIFYYIFNAFVFLFLTHYYRPFKISAQFSIVEVKKLISVGLPIFVLGYLSQLTKTFGRIILIHFASFYVIGVFSPATALYTAIAILPGTIAQFLYPKFSFLYGKHNKKSLFIPYVNKIYLISLLLIIPTFLVAYFAFPIIFERYFPKYKDGLFAAQLFLMSGVIDITTITINIFYSINLRKVAAIYILSRMVFMFVIPLLLIFYSIDPLSSVSIGTLSATIASSVIAYALLIKKLRDSSD